LNFSNKALSSATPAFNDVIKQSPELMRMFTNATVNSMSNNSPAFAMASNLMQENSRPRGPPPPAPVETKSQPPPQRPGSNMNFTEAPSNRPDLNAGRGSTMFYEQGVELNNTFRDVNQEDRSTRQMNFPPQPQQQPRPEMRGPITSDIDNILSGLKTRNINIQETTNTEDDSMVSISSLKDIQNNNMPKRSNRKKNSSAKNTISLDI
jgi:hypothetical protein